MIDSHISLMENETSHLEIAASIGQLSAGISSLVILHFYNRFLPRDFQELPQDHRARFDSAVVTERVNAPVCPCCLRNQFIDCH